jgi:2,3,4,5-tetrahydropyridine-2-carboxylate N-succinyltransferase
MHPLAPRIHTAWQNRQTLSENALSELQDSLSLIFHELEQGILRVAQKNAAGTWETASWVKEAILLYFQITQNQCISGGFTQFFDKIQPQFADFTAEDFKKRHLRVVPPATVRQGAYLGPNVILMPSYVNVGAYVDEGTLIDTWATVGSCAQIGKHVHISGGVGIGGVLEPLQASPTIIEDHCFIGARSEIVEGVVVESGAVISMGVFLGQSTRIYDRENDTVLYGRVPANSVVVPGSLPGHNGKYHLNCAVIVKRVDQQTREKVGLNAILREALS